MGIDRPAFAALYTRSFSRLADRRRRRRRSAITAAVTAVVILVAGAGCTSSRLLDDPAQEPSYPVPSSSPAPGTVGPNTGTPEPTDSSRASAAPGRSLASANLITATDLAEEGVKITVADPSVTRTLGQVSICENFDSTQLSELGGLQILQRNFLGEYQRQPGEARVSDDPLTGQPTVYAAAIQFTDEAAAKVAFDTYTTWVDDCRDRLITLGYDVKKDKNTWYDAPTAQGQGKFAQVIHSAEPGVSDTEGATFESIGLTQVRDRMAITVTLAYGQDYYANFQSTPDPDAPQFPPHPQFRLIELAALRLQS